MAEQEQNQQEKTEEATPKRREDARKKGNVAKSLEVNSSAILMISLLFFFFMGKYMMDNMAFYSKIVFENYGSVFINQENIQGYLQMAALAFLKVIFPFISVIMIAGLGVNMLQVGPLFSLEPMKPKFSKINPISGFKKVLFSRKALVELIKNIFKITLVGLIAYYQIKNSIVDYRSLMDQSTAQIMLFISTESFSLGMKIMLVLITMALLDFIFQKKDYARNIRMTKQEVKEEYKQMEGDPYIKARIRSIQRDMARKRMMDEVPEADVVITNPTELAIALKYTPGEMEAPTIIAKGRKKIAEKIRKLAIENDVPIVEDKPLAWALYRTIDVGQMVSEELFQSVAEVLAYVYKLKDKKLA
ncbi:MAG: flagellar biosynthesis protein FlhB [bacterium]|nr:flagellar biosynthesis protein FlhB [bacterium]